MYGDSEPIQAVNCRQPTPAIALYFGGTSYKLLLTRAVTFRVITRRSNLVSGWQVYEGGHDVHGMWNLSGECRAGRRKCSKCSAVNKDGSPKASHIWLVALDSGYRRLPLYPVTIALKSGGDSRCCFWACAEIMCYMTALFWFENGSSNDNLRRCTLSHVWLSQWW